MGRNSKKKTSRRIEARSSDEDKDDHELDVMKEEYIWGANASNLTSLEESYTNGTAEFPIDLSTSFHPYFFRSANRK
jgi:hypothetical protein